jgi:hypothetical protein
MRKRSLQDLISRHGELRTTGHSDRFGDSSRVEQFSPCLGERSLGLCLMFVYTGLLFLVAERLNLCWIAAWDSVASEVCVSILLHKINIEQLLCFCSGLIVVPGTQMAVYEGDCFGQVVIILYDVGEVGICFSSFVSRCV